MPTRQKLFYLSLVFLFCISNIPFAQNPEWIHYTNGDEINAVDMEGDFVWVGTVGGLAKINRISGDKTFFNKANSGLPGNYVGSIAIDGSGNTWIGTGSGLALFDGTNWTVYNTSNSGLPDNYVGSIAIDGSGNKWIGTSGGLAKFDGTNWTVYNTSSSGLPSIYVSYIAIDESDIKWIGTGSGLALFDGTNWTVYNTSNSGLPNNSVRSIAIDGSGNKWIGTWGGLALFDGTNWTVYNTSNSGLPDNNVRSIAIDGSGNKWIGSLWNGLFVFNEGGVVLRIDDEMQSNTLATDFILHQNYPNPFNPITTIHYDLPQRSDVQITIHDLLGRKVTTLLSETQDAGYKLVQWDATNVSSGMYFYQIRAGDFVQTKKLILLK